jgi:muramoyltetrapeptide carboxypeptidase
VAVDQRDRAAARFAEMGLEVEFSGHVEECDEFSSSSIGSRVADLHDAFADSSIRGIFTILGGYNANQLLPYLDWELIATNPKNFCGYSDITALSCAIHARTGLVTYSGPHFSTFGMRDHFEQTFDWFTQMLMIDPANRDVASPVELRAAATWSDDAWYRDQDQRTIRPNEGYWVLQPGQAGGSLVGGNLCTFNLLHGTPYMPDIDGRVMFIEDDLESSPETFDRDLTSLTQQPGFGDVQSLLIGRFQTATAMTRPMLEAIVRSKRELRSMPIIANMDFGHTDPIATIPVGGMAHVIADEADPHVVIRPGYGVGEART